MKRKMKWLLFVIVIGVLWSAVAVSADTTLPVRPPVPPTPTPVSVETSDGGLLKLHVPASQAIEAGTNTMVQWQNDHGEWYEVEGWRATFDGTREIVWWVSPAEMGNEQLYRWIVLSADGVWLHESAPFEFTMSNWEPQVVMVNWSEE